MAIESKVVNNTLETPRQYPYLGVFPDGEIVLFTSKDTGVTVAADTFPYRLGRYSDDWAEHKTGVFNGEVTLKNK